MILLQTAAAAPPATIDLLFRPACVPGTPDDVIVVCGRSDAAERHRLKPLLDVGAAQLLPKAETALAGGTLAAEAESAQLLGGAVSERAMIRYTLKF